MSILPSWPFAAAALALGIVFGATADHAYMSRKIDRLNAQHADQERFRAIQQADNERLARQTEDTWVNSVGKIQQEKQDEIASINRRHAAELDSVRQRADRKPAGTSGVPKDSAACSGNTGAELSRPDAEFLAGEAARAESLRAALVACYKAYDAVSVKQAANH